MLFKTFDERQRATTKAKALVNDSRLCCISKYDVTTSGEYLQLERYFIHSNLLFFRALHHVKNELCGSEQKNRVAMLALRETLWHVPVLQGL